MSALKWEPVGNADIKPLGDICTNVRYAPPDDPLIDPIVVLLARDGSLYAFHDIYDLDYPPDHQPGQKLAGLEPPPRTTLSKIAWAPSSAPYDQGNPRIGLWALDANGRGVWYGDCSLKENRDERYRDTRWRYVNADQVYGGLTDITADEQGSLLVSKFGAFWECRLPQLDLIDHTSMIPVQAISAGANNVWAVSPVGWIWRWTLMENGSYGWETIPGTENISAANLNVTGLDPPHLWIIAPDGTVKEMINAHSGQELVLDEPGWDILAIASDVRRSWCITRDKGELYRWKLNNSNEYVPLDGIRYTTTSTGGYGSYDTSSTMEVVIHRRPPRIESVLEELYAEVQAWISTSASPANNEDVNLRENRTDLTGYQTSAVTPPTKTVMDVVREIRGHELHGHTHFYRVNIPSLCLGCKDSFFVNGMDIHLTLPR